MRHIYIDAGANWANTLRLFHDLEPAAASKPWEVYAFEASPLILPFLEKFARWLSSGSDGAAPTSCLPTSGSTDDLLHWSRAGIGCPEHSMDAMRECMWSVFDAPLAALAPDPRLSGERLINHRLSTARQAHAQNSSRYTLIPAGVSAGPEPISYITIDSNPHQLTRGGATTLGRSTNKSYEYRVPVVDIVSWIISSFEPVDEVLFKIDVEGVEHEIFEQLTQRGAWKLIDILVFECHRRPAPARTCHELMQSVEAAAPHLKFYQEGWQKGRPSCYTNVMPSGLHYAGVDSLSKPTREKTAAMLHACGLKPPAVMPSAKPPVLAPGGTRATAPAKNARRVAPPPPPSYLSWLLSS